ncbi:hypothetical protein SLA2020_422030 [Shorea laevis]
MSKLLPTGRRRCRSRFGTSALDFNLGAKISLGSILFPETESWHEWTAIPTRVPPGPCQRRYRTCAWAARALTADVGTTLSFCDLTPSSDMKRD